jgi:hypothetical protein
MEILVDRSLNDEINEFLLNEQKKKKDFFFFFLIISSKRSNLSFLELFKLISFVFIVEFIWKNLFKSERKGKRRKESLQ